MRKLFFKIVFIFSMMAAVPSLVQGAIGKHLIEAKSKLPVLSYKVISGEADTWNSPLSWTLKGQTKNGQWIVLDTRQGERFCAVYQEKFYTVEKPGKYVNYLLEVDSDNNKALEIKGVELFEKDVNAGWNHFKYPKVTFTDEEKGSKGSNYYKQLVYAPDDYVQYHTKEVAKILYFNADEQMPAVEEIQYKLKNYKGISGKSGEPPVVRITYSTQHIEKCGDESLEKLNYETRGVLFHELVHAYQLEPKGIGSYGTNKTFWAFIEGVADAVRAEAGLFDIKKLRKPGGNWMDGYKTTGFFIQWLTTKDPDAIRKFNATARELNPWSFDGAIKMIFGKDASIEGMWQEYQDYLIALRGPSKIAYVNPFIGTNGMGHTFPGACVPHGIVQLSPDTDTIPHSVNGRYQARAYEYCAGYQHKDSTIVGFSHTHFNGTGHSDLGDILIMPATGAVKVNPGTEQDPDSGYRSRFSHETEKANPGYYSVLLADYNIKAELTTTERVGVHKYTYPKGEGHIILDLMHGIYNYDGKVLWANLRVENDTLLTGYRITNGWSRVNYTYFAISLSKPIKDYGYTERGKTPYSGFWRKFNIYKNFPEIGGRKVVAYFNFDFTDGKPLEVKVALSGVSSQGALANLNKEAKGKPFEQLRKAAEQKWEDALSVIEVSGEKDQTCNLYSSLYHTMINPSVYMDHDGSYRGIDHNIHQAKGFTNYTVFSVWDTYRALHPLFNIISPERSSDIAKSMLAHYSQSVHGSLPIWSHMGNENWCMIGYHGVSVIADAYVKGIKMDGELAKKAVLSSSNIPYLDGTKEYKELGYAPVDRVGSGASITLEYSYDDWAIYNMLRKMGDPRAAEYKKRAASYKNLMDSSTAFIRAKDSKGNWIKKFDPLNTHGQGYIEGNAWNYSFYVPQDVDGLKEGMGGDKRFIERLDSLFTMELPAKYYANTEDVTKEGLMGNYVHGNEPSHHIAYLYAWTSQPWKAQKQIREILDKMYRNNIDGLCGNDDCGQMSAWYIFSSMGFYPVCPGSDQYILGAPYFKQMKVNLENGKTFEIKAPAVSAKNCYIKSVKLNGKPYTKGYISHKDIMNGGELSFEMSDRPNKQRVFTGEDRPYSLLNDK